MKFLQRAEDSANLQTAFRAVADGSRPHHAVAPRWQDHRGELSDALSRMQSKEKWKIDALQMSSEIHSLMKDSDDSWLAVFQNPIEDDVPSGT